MMKRHGTGIFYGKGSRDNIHVYNYCGEEGEEGNVVLIRKPQWGCYMKFDLRKNYGEDFFSF